MHFWIHMQTAQNAINPRSLLRCTGQMAGWRNFVLNSLIWSHSSQIIQVSVGPRLNRINGKICLQVIFYICVWYFILMMIHQEFWARLIYCRRKSSESCNIFGIIDLISSRVLITSNVKSSLTRLNLSKITSQSHFCKSQSHKHFYILTVFCLGPIICPRNCFLYFSNVIFDAKGRYKSYSVICLLCLIDKKFLWTL